MSSFFDQLRRRNVIKSAISYVVLSWAILQAADIIFPLLHIEDSVLRVILMVLVIGFPIWVVFAYFFEWTASGFKLTSQVAEEKSISKTTSRRLNHYIIGGLIIAVILLVADRLTNFSGTLPNRSFERSIAVLPFDNLGDPETSYFAEGMAEDILTQLSKVADLRVLSRVTLKSYDAAGKSVEQIGEDLGVNYLLTGSVRKVNNQVRVSCQLVQVNPEEQTWAENFDRQMNDIFRIQSEVAINISEELQTNLTSDEKIRIELEPTQNLEAYTLYLRGREAYGRYTSEGMREAATLFKLSIKEDPDFALGYAGLADAFGQLAYIQVLPNSYYDTALLYGKKSVQLNPELSEGWKAIGLVHSYSGDPAKAKSNYEKALEFNPNYHPAMANLVGCYGMLGYFDKAMITAGKSLRLNPLNSHSYTNIADGLKYIGMYDSALSLVKRSIEIDPKSSAYGIEADIYLELGEYENAKRSIDKMIELDSASFLQVSGASRALRFDANLAFDYLTNVQNLSSLDSLDQWTVCSLLGYLIEDADSAQTWIDAGIEHFEAMAASSRSINVGMLQELLYLYSLNGQLDEAVTILEKKIEKGFIYSERLKNDPRLSNLWEYPEFIRLVQQLDQRRSDYRMRLTANADTYLVN